MTDVDAALAEAHDARKKLAGTLSQVQARLNPRALAQEAVTGARERGRELSQQGLATARRNPGVVAAILAAIGLFLARRWIAGRVLALVRGRRKTPDLKPDLKHEGAVSPVFGSPK